MADIFQDGRYFRIAISIFTIKLDIIDLYESGVKLYVLKHKKTEFVHVESIKSFLYAFLANLRQNICYILSWHVYFRS